MVANALEQLAHLADALDAERFDEVTTNAGDVVGCSGLHLRSAGGGEVGVHHPTIVVARRSRDPAELDHAVEAAREQSRFHPRCGTSFLLFVLIASIALFALICWLAVLVNELIRTVRRAGEAMQDKLSANYEIFQKLVSELQEVRANLPDRGTATTRE